jgi:DNA-binding LacI/PurR family transcriptional regulator
MAGAAGESHVVGAARRSGLVERSGRTRIADVARGAGVSKTTVSFAFNSPDRVKPETARRIREVARALGYEPHPVARMLAQRRTRTIGLLTPQALAEMFANPFFAAFSEGVAVVAEAHGFGLHFISPLHGSLARAVGRATVDGVVAIGLSGDHPEIEQIRQAGLPTVLVDSTAFESQGVVDIDDEEAAYAAGRHLADLGHRDVIVIAVEPPHPVTRLDPDGVMGRRLRGYRRALAEAGVEMSDEAVLVCPASIEGGAEAFRRAWQSGLRPTGVLAMSDSIAIGVVRAARDLRIPVPEGLSIVGFDDVEIAALVDPPLTTIHQPIREKGEAAAELLLTALSGGGSAPLERRRMPARLIVRASSAPAPRVREEVVSVR